MGVRYSRKCDNSKYPRCPTYFSRGSQMFAFSESAINRFIIFLKPPAPSISDDYWLGFYRSLPPARFIVWLANEVVTVLILTHPYGIDELVLRVKDNTSSYIQAKAERFIRRRVILLPFRPTPQRITLVFRKIIYHKLRRCMINNPRKRGATYYDC
jgi:hypothetical protein